MGGFVIRKYQRLRRLVPVRYLGEGIAGEGIIKDLSLSGSNMSGNARVSVGMPLALHMFVPGDPEPVLIDRTIVKWVTGSEFGVDFDTLHPTVTERITKIISRVDSFREG